ncbi:MAG: DUF4124 domain-containing protein, partial [Comamonadaceae bacterium]
VIAALSVTAGGAAHAQVNRCVDDHGKITFSDTLCQGARAQKEFGINASAKGWQGEDSRGVRMAQNSGTNVSPASGRPATTAGPQPR